MNMKCVKIILDDGREILAHAVGGMRDTPVPTVAIVQAVSQARKVLADLQASLEEDLREDIAAECRRNEVQ
jgi:hypothetical protein